MLQKSQPSPTTTSQLKRALHSSTPYQQPLDSQSTIQQLISRIQSTIFTTSQSMKHQLCQYEQHELLNYKNDLLKTQDQFIKIRAQRNEQAIKTCMLKEKALVEDKFNTQIRKSMEMNANYDQMKALVKRMNQDQREIILEINYLKKKIAKQTQEGHKLDQELTQIQMNNDQRQSKRLSNKMDQERKLFTELVNKCQVDCTQKKSYNKLQDSQKLNPMQTNQTKMEKRLKYEISNLKDYIQNIPLDLNFVQNMLYQSIKDKFLQTKIILGQQLKEELSVKQELQQEEGDEIGDKEKDNEDKANENKQEQPKNISIQNKKNLIKLPSITNTNILKVKGVTKNSKQNKQNSHYLNKLNRQDQEPKPLQAKSRIAQKEKQAKQSREIPDIEELPKSSALLQEILSNPQVKQYFYKIMFEGGVEEEK